MHGYEVEHELAAAGVANPGEHLADGRGRMPDPQWQRLPLKGEHSKRNQPAETGSEEDQGEGVRGCVPVAGPLEQAAADDKSGQHRQLRHPRAVGEEVGAERSGHQGAHPGIPGRAGGQPASPIDGRHDENSGGGNPPGDRRQGQRNEGQRLDQHAKKDPPLVGTHPADRQGGERLHEAAGQQGNACDQPRRDLAKPHGKGKRRQVGLAQAGHSAGGRALGMAGNQVLAQTPLWAATEDVSVFHRQSSPILYSARTP